MTFAKMERLIAISGDRAELDRIARPDAALAIWWRRVSEPLLAALAELDLGAIHDVVIEMDAADSVEAALRSAGYRRALVGLLAADVALLARRHSALTGEDRLRLRLEVLDAEASGRFRADFSTFTLQCTYIGIGTQWCCVDGQDAICDVPTGAVAVFKGRMLLDPPAVLHRPPSIRGRRLVLTIDPVPSL